jgi:hypothetical protein
VDAIFWRCRPLKIFDIFRIYIISVPILFSPISISFAQIKYLRDQKIYGFCIGSTETAVYASDIFELSTVRRLQQADQDWRAYLASTYQGHGACQDIKATSKQAAYSALEAAAGTVQRTVDAAGQAQLRHVFHTGWRAGG